MKLREIDLKGFKSIDGQNGQTIPLGDVTVLLGANGSSKSNYSRRNFCQVLSSWMSLNWDSTPAAIAELSGLVRAAAQKTQVLLATQSTRLIDEFLPEDLVVVEWDAEKRCSIFKKLDTDRLKDWLDRYSLSEPWEKNVLGGQP